MKKVYSTILRPTNSSLIKLPSILSVFYRNEGRMIGRCIDFNLVVHSDKTDDKKAILELQQRLSEITVFHILAHYQRRLMENLYYPLVYQHKLELADKNYSPLKYSYFGFFFFDYNKFFLNKSTELSKSIRAFEKRLIGDEIKHNYPQDTKHPFGLLPYFAKYKTNSIDNSIEVNDSYLKLKFFQFLRMGHLLYKELNDSQRALLPNYFFKILEHYNNKTDILNIFILKLIELDNELQNKFEGNSIA